MCLCVCVPVEYVLCVGESVMHVSEAMTVIYVGERVSDDCVCVGERVEMCFVCINQVCFYVSVCVCVCVLFVCKSVLGVSESGSVNCVLCVRVFCVFLLHCHVCWIECLTTPQYGRKKMFYLMTHSILYIYGYMAWDIW